MPVTRGITLVQCALDFLTDGFFGLGAFPGWGAAPFGRD
jgi:hypothetical protein